MTSITLNFKKPISFVKKDFYDADDLLNMLLKQEFEKDLDEAYKVVKNSPKEDFVNL